MRVILVKKKLIDNKLEKVLAETVLTSEGDPVSAAFDVVLAHVKKCIYANHCAVGKHIKAESNLGARRELYKALEFLKVSYGEVDTFQTLQRINSHLKELAAYFNSEQQFTVATRQKVGVPGLLFERTPTLQMVPYSLTPYFFTAKEMETDRQLDSVDVNLPAVLNLLTWSEE